MLIELTNHLFFLVVRKAPILYSPCYYWYRFILGVVFLVQNGITFHLYEKVCPPGDSDGNMEGSIFYILMMIFWGIQGAFHLFFIVHRLVAKTPVSDVLYDGPIESKLSIFLVSPPPEFLIIALISR